MTWRHLLAVALLVVGCGDDDVDPEGGGGEGGTNEGGAGAAGGAEDGGGGAAPTCADLACDAGSFCFDGACRECDTTVGSQHDQVLTTGDGEEDRFFFFHVPASYACGAPAPILVDFHGTSGGNRPEESYQNDALVALADAHGAIVVRPRSRSSAEGGQDIYRWDQNPGDLERNVTFTGNLVRHLRERFDIDEARIYASGFSSGSNMTSQFLGAERGLFKGLAPIAGGIWSDPGIDPFEGDAPRFYFATGYRDYLHFSARDLLDLLAENGVSERDVFVRETDNGHDLYPWHFEELWSFLDTGEKPEIGAVSPPWTPETVPSGASILTLTARADSTVVATGTAGQVWLRDAEGAWQPPVSTDLDLLTGACVDGTGNVFVVGESRFVRGSAALQFDLPSPVPELFGTYFGQAYLNGIGCNGASPLATGGYWSGAKSEDGGLEWTGLEFDAGGYPAQVSAVHVTSAGTIVGVGYFDYIGRGAAGATALDMRPHPGTSDWLTDVTSAPGGHVWVVGDRGTILHSADDGVSWAAQDSGTPEDLYTVAFSSDALRGVVAGRRGVVRVTSDGGASWSDLALGNDAFIGAAVFVDATTLLVAGEGGLVARVDLGQI